MDWIKDLKAKGENRAQARKAMLAEWRDKRYKALLGEMTGQQKADFNGMLTAALDGNRVAVIDGKRKAIPEAILNMAAGLKDTVTELAHQATVVALTKEQADFTVKLDEALDVAFAEPLGEKELEEAAKAKLAEEGFPEAAPEEPTEEKPEKTKVEVKAEAKAKKKADKKAAKGKK